MQLLQARYDTAIAFSLAFRATSVNAHDKNDGAPIFEETLERLTAANGHPWSFTTASTN